MINLTTSYTVPNLKQYMLYTQNESIVIKKNITNIKIRPLACRTVRLTIFMTYRMSISNLPNGGWINGLAFHLIGPSR